MKRENDERVLSERQWLPFFLFFSLFAVTDADTYYMSFAFITLRYRYAAMLLHQVLPIPLG